LYLLADVIGDMLIVTGVRGMTVTGVGGMTMTTGTENMTGVRGMTVTGTDDMMERR